MAKEKKKKLSKAEITKQKQVASLKNMYFNRFLMVRYLLAVMVFSNFFLAYLSWGTFTGIAALVLLALSIIPVWEMGRIYTRRDQKHEWTRIYYWAQLVFNCGMSFLIWTVPMDSILPFFTDTAAARGIAAVIFAAGIVLCGLCLRRIGQIDAGTDRQLQRIKFFEDKYKLQVK